MHDKDTFNYKLIIANITLVWLLSSVDRLVSAKLTFLHKVLIAILTLIRLLSSIDKDTFIYKLLVASPQYESSYASPIGRYQMIDIDICMSWIFPIFLPVLDHIWECMDETDHYLLDLLDLGLCLAGMMNIFLICVLSWAFRQVMYDYFIYHLLIFQVTKLGTKAPMGQWVMYWRLVVEGLVAPCCLLELLLTTTNRIARPVVLCCRDEFFLVEQL